MKVKSLDLHDYMVNKQKHLIISVNSKYRTIDEYTKKDFVMMLHLSQWVIVDTIFLRSR